MLDELATPIVQAPMAGGPSTPELAAAVSACGALGFIAAGYRTPDALRDDVAAVRGLTSAPFGVNVFARSGAPAPAGSLDAYVAELEGESAALGAALGEVRFDDDRYDDKVALLVADPVAVVSFTFGCPEPSIIAALRGAGSAVWVTVTDAAEARLAASAGADALVVQGVEAGGHRGSYSDAGPPGDVGLLALLQLVADAVELPLVATGGIATGRGVAAVLAAGAGAAQLGTAFMRCPEAGTAPAHRDLLASPTRTALTRAFTGRLARGLENRFMADHGDRAPRAYPEIHHVTAPLRAHARRSGDPDLINLWAGQAHELARDIPAAELVAELVRDARVARDAARRL